ncbi:MAG: choice-of-anchor V domain-containing protein [Gemmatimonadota bacterium]
MTLSGLAAGFAAGSPTTAAEGLAATASPASAAASPATTAWLHPNADGPPPGHTGGFGEPTCAACHDEFPLNPPGGELRVEGLEWPVPPGASRIVTVLLRSPDMENTGFEAAFRVADGEDAGAPVGRVTPLDDRTAVTRAEADGVEYVHHTRVGSAIEEEAAPVRVARWSFRWTAPARSASVVLHVAANSGNADDSPLGDLIFTTSLAFPVRRGRSAVGVRPVSPPRTPSRAPRPSGG